MLQSPRRLRNDLKCVEWDVKPCCVYVCVQLLEYTDPLPKLDPALVQLRKEIGSFKA